MSKESVVCLAVSLLIAGSALAQKDGWHLLMDRGQAGEKATNYAVAVASYEEAARISDGPTGDPQRLLLSANSAAMMYDALGRFADAERSYRRALSAAERLGGKDSASYAVVLGSLGSLYVEMGQITRGESMLRESIAIHESQTAPDEELLATARGCLAEALMSTGRYEEPERLLTAALAVWQKRPGAWREPGLVMNNLAVVKIYQKQYDEARQYLEHSLQMMETGFAADHPMLARVLNNLATVLGRSGYLQQAMGTEKRALDIVAKYLGADHPVNGILLRNYAALLRESGDKTNARKLEAKSAQVLKQSALRDGLGLVIDISALPRK